ncbi:MAG: cupin domain-containing protein [Cucumibacter sp.]
MPDNFTLDGFAGPIPLYSADECRTLVAALTSPGAPAPGTWAKGRAASDPAFWAVASHENLLAPLRQLLGPDIVLWGACLVVRGPGQVHRWHTDVESADPAGGFASVWIGLENVNAGTGLDFIAGSHRVGKSIQQLVAESGAGWSDAEVLALATERVAGARLAHPAIADGEAFIFDGRLWHGSRHSGGAARTALLLQYAAAGRRARIPSRGYKWPFAYRILRRPPCILVCGVAPAGVNRLVPPPASARPGLDHQAHAFALPLFGEFGRFKSKGFFRGATPVMADVESHASILAPGARPHPPHRHKEEEILLVLDGEADLVLPEGPGGEAPRRRLRRGEFAYYPARRWHTLDNPGPGPVSYVMFKWTSPPGRQGEALATRFVAFGEALAGSPAKAFASTRLLDEPTLWLDRLHAHVSIVRPGGGYGAHADTHDVAIVLLEGEIETLGETVAAPALLYHPAGRIHGLKGAGKTPARYLVFEFHRKGGAASTASRATGGLFAGARAALRRRLRKLRGR